MTTGTKAIERPWSAIHRDDEAAGGSLSEYGAWERWFARADDAATPDADGTAPILDTLDLYQRIGLYVVMCRLADGEYPRAEATA